MPARLRFGRRLVPKLNLGTALVFLVLSACQPVVPSEQAIGESLSQVQVEEGVAEAVQDSNAGDPAVVATTDSVPVTESGQGGPDVAPADNEDAVVDTEALLVGMAVYRKQYCGICHQLSAAETTGTFGPGHDGIGSVAVQRIAEAGYAGKATTPDEYLRESIIEPAAYIVEGYAATAHRMPSFAHLEDSEIEALVVFLLAQK